MDVRTPFFQNIAYVLIGVLFLNPIVTTAAELALDAQAGSNAALAQAANGVPIVNIATPNGSGLSHNKFTDFNVSQQGLILNNATDKLQSTQLGGLILGNPNLKGQAAGLILNEVNGGSPSQLRGYTEVAGKSAAVIVANPHGISCDGCGFINTPRVTLSTGKPIVENGKLDRFDVEGGQIRIEGDGLNARNVSQFDLITRSAQINAELHANQLNVITGRNDVDAANLTATAKADDGSAKTQLAIDSSALGGMYAGAIRLVGTEAGVGVKLASDMAASAGDIQIDANGQLSMARTAASRDLQLKAENIELNADTFAGRNAVIDASGQTRVKESLAASQQLTVKGGELLNKGVVEAGVRADGSLNNTATLSLQTNTVTNPGTITSHGNLKTDVQTLDNRAGKLLSAGDATLKAQTLENSAGRIVAQKNLELSGNQLNNQSGEVLAKQAITVTAANLANQNGTLAGGALDLQLSANLNNQNGLIESASDLQLAANTLSNNGGKLRALGGEAESRFVLGGLFNNDAGLVEIGSGAFALSSVGLSNLGGTVRHVGDQGFAIDMTALGQAGGRFITNGAVDLSLNEWSNISSLQAKTLNIAINRLTQSATGALLAVDGITTSGERWENHGRIETDGALHLTLSDAYTGNGKLLAQGDLSLTAKRADLGSAAELRSSDSARIDISTGLSNAGKITSVNDLSVKAASLNNQGTLGAAKKLRIESNALRNEQGLIFSGSDMFLLSDTLHNVSGDIYSAGQLDIARNTQGQASSLFSNLSGTIESVGDLRLSADSITNARAVLDVLSHKAAARMTYAGCYDCSGKRNANYVLEEIDRTEVINSSARASLLSGGNMLVQGRDFLNSSSLIAASGNLSITAQNFTNKGAALGEYRTQRFLNSHRTNNIGAVFNSVDAFNARNWPQGGGNISAEINNFLQAYIYEHYLLGAPVFTPQATVEYAGILQAGQAVTINAINTFAQSVVRPSFDYVSGGSRLGDISTGSTIATTVTLNPQLPPDLAQQAVDPLALPGFSLPQGQNGLFQINTQVGHRYLIETNPVFASLKNFLNSDYMLGNLGYDPQTAQKRLGDGLYEQRLIREAVVARTGQRYLAGLNSDEAQFRYLMDNAIASKQALKLSLGVSLTAEQVAALTHDLVWMEEREVAGQKVLVPVLYLAQAEGRLAPSGALIQGRDVTLISGGNLTNQGTLRASNNLSVTANTISNSGLMQASERLSLLATDSIRNAQGGIIAGKDVTAIALTGDIVNERSVTRHESGRRGYQHQQDFVDSAARIEASGDLTLAAGRDIQNIGSALKAGGDMQLNAGRDLVIASAQEHDLTTRKDRKGNSRSEQITQYGSEVEAGGNIVLSAKRDLAIIASRVSAEEDLSATAGGDVMIAAAANEDHFESHRKSGGKKVDIVDSQVRQQAAELSAVGNLKVLAGNDLTAVASKFKAGDEAYLYAGNQLSLLAAQNSDYSLYDMKKKGSWGSKETQRDETTTIRNIGTSIESGGDLTLVSKGDQLYQKARLESGADLTLDSGGSITFEAVKDLDQESHEKSKGDAFWTSAKGKGQTDETLRQSVLLAQGEVVIKAVDGLKIDIKQIDQKAVSQTIDAMVQAEPELAWLKQAEARGDVDWRQVNEIHDSFKYEHSGLGPASQLIIAIAMAVIMGPAGFGLTGMNAAVATSVATTATTSAINNKGNLGAVLKDVTSSDSIKGYAFAAVTAGLGGGYDPTTLGFNVESLGRVAGKVAVDAGLKTAFYGGSLKDNLASAALSNAASVVSAAAFKQVGDYASDQLAQANGDAATIALWKEGGAARIAMHAAVGGMVSQAMGKDFASGAIAAGASQALAGVLDEAFGQKGDMREAMSQAIGITAAGLAGKDVETAAFVALQADKYNRQLHSEEEQWLREKAKEFAKKAGISPVLALERLTQQALKEVDFIWRAQLADGDDLAAKAYLAGSPDTFVNELGERQKFFTSSVSQLISPQMFADTADKQLYQMYAHSGISRDLKTGLLKEFKDAGLGIVNDGKALTKAIQDNPQAAVEAAFNGIWPAITGIPGGVKDSFIEAGGAIGEGTAVALDPELTAKLVDIYGTDVASLQKATLAIRVLASVTGAAAVGKAGSKVAEATTKAVVKKLDEVKAAKLEAEALAKAREDNNFYAEGWSSSPAGLNTSAGVIPANPNKTTTVLGRWVSDMRGVIGDATDGIEGQLNPGGALAKTEDFGAKPGGFNVLNVPKSVEDAAGGEFFEKVNKPFLNEAIKRRDDIALGTIPNARKDVIEIETGLLKGNFAKELDYLVRNNYRPVNVSTTQWETIKGWFK